MLGARSSSPAEGDSNAVSNIASGRRLLFWSAVYALTYCLPRQGQVDVPQRAAPRAIIASSRSSACTPSMPLLRKIPNPRRPSFLLIGFTSSSAALNFALFELAGRSQSLQSAYAQLNPYRGLPPVCLCAGALPS
ncbi:MAG: hypothetical protein ACLS7Z_07390 [Christensenellales bacterium]